MSNRIIESTVQRVLEKTKNSFRIRRTVIDYGNLEIFDKISKMIKDDVLDITAEGIYTTTFKMFKLCRYLHLEIYVYETTIEVYHTLITY